MIVIIKIEFRLNWRITQGTILIMGQIFILDNEVCVISLTKVVSSNQEGWIPFENVLNKHSFPDISIKYISSYLFSQCLYDDINDI